MKSKVFIKPVEGNLTECVKECFNQFGGVDSFTKENVFLKINATSSDLNSITKPEVVVAVIKAIKEANPPPKNIYVMDNAAVGGFSRLAFKVGNMAKKILQAGGIPLYLDEQKPVNVDFNGKILGKRIPIPKVLHEKLILNRNDNAYINIPVLKSHVMCQVTICIKNQHGLLYDNEKIFEHQHIDEKIIDIMELFKPDFHIVDATSVIDYGPFCIDNTYCHEMNLLLSGIDPVAVDTIGSKLIGIEDVKHISLAAKRTFGTNKMEEIEVVPSLDLINKHKIPLHWQGNPIDIPDKIKIIEGKTKGCITGCGTLALALGLIAMNKEKINPMVGICGKGFDTKEMDQYNGPFLIDGKCAVAELKDYFEIRKRKEKIKVYYIDEHLDLAAMMTCGRKAMGLGMKSAYEKLMPVGLAKILGMQISSKLHGGKFLGAK